MKKMLAIAVICFCFIFTGYIGTTAAEDCDGYGCPSIYMEGNIGFRDGQWDNVNFTPAPVGSNHAQTEINGGQYIDAWAWGDGQVVAEGEALKEQAMVWYFEDGPAIHFGSDYMGAWGNWGVNEDCSESELKIDTYAWVKTQTDHSQTENAFGMQQYTDMNAGGKIVGYGDPIDGAFSIIKSAGSYQAIGDPECDPVYGWQYNNATITIKGGNMPEPPEE